MNEYQIRLVIKKLKGKLGKPINKNIEQQVVDECLELFNNPKTSDEKNDKTSPPDARAFVEEQDSVELWNRPSGLMYE